MRNLGKLLIILGMLATLLHAEHNRTFDFTMTADKKEAYLGEPIRVTFVFKYPVDTQIAEANFAPPTFRDFWVKPDKKVPTTIENNYQIYRLDYLITPQRSGHLEIEPARMDIGILTSKKRNTLRFDRVKWKSIFSNALTIDVNPLPQNATLFGTYTIEAAVDKNEVKANEPVHLTLTLRGSGNLEEIPDFEIKIPDAAVYADKPKISTRFDKGIQKGQFVQKFAFISDRNFTIPSLSLTYFDATKKRLKTIQTAPIPVTVHADTHAAASARLEKADSAPSAVSRTPLSRTLWILSILGAFVAGSMLTLLWQKRKSRTDTQKATSTVSERIKKAKSDKALLALLLPYSTKSEEIERIIEQLEANIYQNADYRIDRKKLAKNFDDFVTMSDADEEILL